MISPSQRTTPHVPPFPQVMFPGAPLHQSPPSSSGGFLLLPGGGQQRPGDSGGSPNSTPGLQTPTPAATPVRQPHSKVLFTFEVQDPHVNRFLTPALTLLPPANHEPWRCGPGGARRALPPGHRETAATISYSNSEQQ